MKNNIGICLKVEVDKKKMKTKKKKGRGKAKGSSFERWVCKELSKWWTDGKRDDIFWRTTSSGGQATQRSKVGKTTFGQHGDVQATDPIGQPLIDLCTIEIKRTKLKQSYFDLIDTLDVDRKYIYKKFIAQAQQQKMEAGTFAWMLITKQDYKSTLVAIPNKLKKLLVGEEVELDGCYPQCSFRFIWPDANISERIFVTTLSQFIEASDPEGFKKLAEWIKRNEKKRSH